MTRLLLHATLSLLITINYIHCKKKEFPPTSNRNIIAVAGTDDDGNSVIITSNDGGTTWSSPKKLSLFTNDVRAIAFTTSPSNLVAVSVNGIGWPIYMTSTDTGNTWSDTTSITFWPSAEITKMVFSGPTTGVIVGSQGNQNVKKKQGTYAYTTDGGNNWSIGDTIENKGGLPSSLSIIDVVAFSSSIKGVAIGPNELQPPTLLYANTTDGGQTWAIETPTINPINETNLEVAAITFNTATNGYLVGEGNTQSDYNFLFKSTDGGTSWKNEGVRLMQYRNSNVKVLLFSTTTNGFIVATTVTGRTLYSTTSDGGQTWTDTMNLVAPNLSIIDGGLYDATNGNKGILVGTLFPSSATPKEGGVYFTTDNGGKTWSAVKALPGIKFVTYLALANKYTPYSLINP
ncbi:MAG: sialidase family protein [Phycisphaerales bacterium]|nr:sialidase family protein [Phycisphaerales bacterium]